MFELSERKKLPRTPEYTKGRVLAKYAVEATAAQIIADADVGYLSDQPMDFEWLREVTAFVTGLGREALRAEQRVVRLQNGVTLVPRDENN